MCKYHISAKSPRWIRNTSHSSQNGSQRGRENSSGLDLTYLQIGPLFLSRLELDKLVWRSGLYLWQMTVMIFVNCVIGYWKLGARRSELETLEWAPAKTVLALCSQADVKIICWTVATRLKTPFFHYTSNAVLKGFVLLKIWSPNYT